MHAAEGTDPYLRHGRVYALSISLVRKEQHLANARCAKPNGKHYRLALAPVANAIISECVWIKFEGNLDLATTAERAQKSAAKNAAAP